MMDTTGYVALSRQMALRREMDVVANNIANAETTAFKAQKILFSEFLVEQPGATPDISYVQDRSVFRNTASGALERTGGTLDFAIEGDGYFVVEAPEGRRYTRNGRFILNDAGDLSTREGHPVLDVDNRKISFDPTAPGFEISGDGVISTAEGPLASIGLVRFENTQTLAAEGGGRHRSEEEPKPVEQRRILRGTLESSNVEPIIEMTRMIEISRSYQSAQRMIGDTHDMQRRMIRNLGRVE